MSVKPAALHVSLFAALWICGASTVRDYGLTWDEPYYFWAQEKQQAWFHSLAEDPSRALMPEAIRAGWNPDPYHNPHPPVYKLLANVARALAPSGIDDVTAYRLTPVTFFAASAVMLARLVGRATSTAWGIGAALLWAACPPVFAHAHFAATDTPMTFFAIATAESFQAARLRRRWVLLLGALLGLALATKFTAILLPVPLIAWAVFHRDWRALARVCEAIPLGLVIAVAAVPYWWHDPWHGIAEFVRASTTRSMHTPISGLLWGKVYPFHAPWTQPFVMIMVATPLASWVPAIVAAGRVLPRPRQHAHETLWLAATSVPLAAVLMPQAPNHDGLRLMMPALPFVAALSATQLARWGAWLATRVADRREAHGVRSPIRARLVALVLGGAIASEALAIWVYHPYELSYYNALLGGLRGARHHGMEVTYWMEALTPDVLRTLERVLPPRAQVNLPVGDPFYFRYLQARGRLRRDLDFESGVDARYQLVVSRIAVLGPERMDELDRLPALFTSSFDGVPLVRLFEIARPPPAEPAPS